MRLPSPTSNPPQLSFNPTLFLAIFLFGLLPLKGQQLLPSVKRSIDSIVAAHPQTYLEIDRPVKKFRRDTLYMKYLLEASEKADYLAGQSYALNQMGTKYRNISRYTTAVALHERALELAKNAGNVEFEILSLNMLGVVYRRNDAVKTALDHNQEALALAEEIENPSEGIKRSINVSLNSIGNIYMSLEQYQLAIEQFKRSLVLESELGNRLGLAINHQNIGEAMEAQGRLDDALENYRTSLAYNEEIDSDMGRIICKNSIAQIYIKKGMPHQAMEILVPALADSKALGDKFITAPVYINLGKAQMDVGQYKQAQKNLSEGISMAKRFKLTRVTSDGLSAMAELMEDTGRNKEALTYFKEGVQFDEEVTNERNLRYVNDMIMRYESDKKTNQIQVLAQENEIVKLKLRKNRITLIIGSMALALLLGILFILYRQWQLKKEKEVLTLEQRLLRSQMNPHFLFNSLNSIKLYIINNEQKNAVHYLNKFSKLVRKILDASSVREIPLVEELETVELYMNIENIRFSNEIDFKINVADSIDKHQVKVPSLILQPFLENALWHGLSSKEGEKRISVDVTQENPEFLTIRITDNGVGREAAERIKQNKLLKKKSMGIDITKERLANFSRHYQNTFAVDIIDLADSSQIPIGTQVVLTLPAV